MTAVAQRWLFDSGNGTLIINPAERTDLGTYRVQIFNETTGKEIANHNIHLIIRGNHINLL